MVSTTRLYGAAIAVVSGLYSLWSAAVVPTSGWFMAVLGVVVVIHGAVLVTEYADRLGSASGPLMLGYSVLMLLNQALFGTGMMDGGSMGMTGGMRGNGMTGGMGWDTGTVSLAVLMLVSGLIMTRDTAMKDDSDGL